MERKRDMWVPFKKKKTTTTTTTKSKERRHGQRTAQGEIFFNFIFFLFSSLSQICENRTVRIRRIKNESALRDEGYAWVPKTRDFSKNSGKNFWKS